MRPCASLMIVLLFVLFTLGACGKRADSNAPSKERTESTPTALPEATPSDGVRRVTLEQLQDALSKGEAIAVDTRGTVEYKLGHIKGARSIPLGLIASQIGELPKDKLIVTYCA